jgi:hypothetical protein
MPRGGARPGAGRPPKPRPPLAVGGEANLTALAFLEVVMRDPNADPGLRVSAAKALLTHQRVTAPPKKQRADEMAATADVGTDWEKLLAS